MLGTRLPVRTALGGKEPLGAMKLAVASDIHIEENPLDRFDDQGADAIVLAGDIHASPNGLREFVQSLPLSIPKILVLGNHEYDHWRFPALGFALDDYRVALRELANVHLLERERLDLGEVTILGATPLDRFPSRRPIESEHGLDARIDRRTARSPQDPRGNHAVVAPRATPLEEADGRRDAHGALVRSFREGKPTGPIDGFFASNLDELMEQVGPALWIHGHLHNPSDYVVGRTRVVCNPRGYGDPIAWYESWAPLIIEVPIS